MTRLFPTWRGRRRWTVLALCAVLAALPVADRVAAGVAEGRIADRVAAVSTAVVGTPQVRIDGFPFLLDAARGTFPQVSVRADAVTAEEQPVSAAIELHTVTEKAGTYTAASADGRFTVPLDSLGGGSGGAASLSADEDGRLRIEGVRGLPLTVTAELRLTGRTITAVPVSASFAGRPLDPSAPRIARAFAERDRVVPDLPAGLSPTDVTVGESGVTVHARGEDVRLG